MQEPKNDIETRSSLVSRNVTIQGRRTSVRLEPEMWNALKEIARREQCTIHDICSLIYARKKRESSLTASIRVFLMLYFRSAATEDGHCRAGHGHFANMMARAKIKTAAFKGNQSAKGLNRDEFKNMAVPTGSRPRSIYG